MHAGDRVKAGEPLMDGAANPHDILKVLGEKELARYLVDEVQEVYRLQGVKINDKHIEMIVRQMLRRVRITDVGDTDFLVDEQVEKYIFEEENEKVHGRRAASPAVGEPLLLGITKASLSTESLHLGVARSRRPPRCSPRRPSAARSTTCAASRRTSSWAGSSRPARASPAYKHLDIEVESPTDEVSHLDAALAASHEEAGALPPPEVASAAASRAPGAA